MSTFLLEPLAKKVCSVSFVSQYIVIVPFKSFNHSAEKLAKTNTKSITGTPPIATSNFRDKRLLGYSEEMALRKR